MLYDILLTYLAENNVPHNIMSKNTLFMPGVMVFVSNLKLQKKNGLRIHELECKLNDIITTSLPKDYKFYLYVDKDRADAKCVESVLNEYDDPENEQYIHVVSDPKDIIVADYIYWIHHPSYLRSLASEINSYYDNDIKLMENKTYCSKETYDKAVCNMFENEINRLNNFNIIFLPYEDIKNRYHASFFRNQNSANVIIKDISKQFVIFRDTIRLDSTIRSPAKVIDGITYKCENCNSIFWVTIPCKNCKYVLQ